MIMVVLGIQMIISVHLHILNDRRDMIGAKQSQSFLFLYFNRIFFKNPNIQVIIIIWL